MFVGEQQGGELASHMVFDVIGEHADEDMRTNPGVEAVVDGSDV